MTEDTEIEALKKVLRAVCEATKAATSEALVTPETSKIVEIWKDINGSQSEKTGYGGFPTAGMIIARESKDKGNSDKLFLLLPPKKVEELLTGNEQVPAANIIIAARIGEMTVEKRPDYSGQGM